MEGGFGARQGRSSALENADACKAGTEPDTRGDRLWPQPGPRARWLASRSCASTNRRSFYIDGISSKTRTLKLVSVVRWEHNEQNTYPGTPGHSIMSTTTLTRMSRSCRAFGAPATRYGQETPEGHVCLFGRGDRGVLRSHDHWPSTHPLGGPTGRGVTIPSPPHSEDLDREELGDLADLAA